MFIMLNNEDDYLQLSGIQHFAFCQRQWALIHIEKLWVENLLTTEGHILHEKVNNPYYIETSSSLIVSRAVPIVSHELGLNGKADLIEYMKAPDAANAVFLERYGGYWFPVPVEYKRGRPKKDDRDIIQLCAQAMCLEEMHQVKIENGHIYYGQTRHRIQVKFDYELRCRVKDLSHKMHELFEKGVTPPASPGINCSLCSLVNLCLPKLTKKKKSARGYMEREFAKIKTESYQESC